MFIRPLSTELQKKSESELNEVSDRIQDDLKHIREWVEKQPHLKLRTEDQWLLTFLRGCKFSLQRTKEKLDYFYTVRTLVPEFFASRDPFLPEIQEVLKIGGVLPLPNTADPAAPKILIFQWGICDPEKVTYANLMKTYFMCLDILMNEDDNCAIAGAHLFADLKGFSANYLLQCTPSALKKTALSIEKAYPIRVKKVDCVNVPNVFEVVYSIAKPFLSEKLKSRINLYAEQNFDKVYATVPQTLLPREYGGDNGSIAELTVEWKKKIESYREWFLEDAKFCSYEKLRRGKPKTAADVFGVEGTFRKLSID